MKKFFSITLAALLLSSSLCSGAKAECVISESLKKLCSDNKCSVWSIGDVLGNLKGNISDNIIDGVKIDFSDMTSVIEKIKDAKKLDISQLLQGIKKEDEGAKENAAQPDKPENEEGAKEEIKEQPSWNNNAQSVITGENSQFISEVIRLVNEERTSRGLLALTVDADLQKAAQIRAAEQESVFSHTRPNGQSCFTVLAECSVSYSGAGENIAMGQTSPEQVMNGWMNSEGHRANILNAKFAKIGVGCHRDSNGKYYWSQMFVY